MAGFGLQFLNGLGESSDVEVLPANDLENKSADSYSASVVDSDFETSRPTYIEPHVAEPQTVVREVVVEDNSNSNSDSDSINLSFTMRDAVIFGAGAIAAMIIGKLIK